MYLLIEIRKGVKRKKKIPEFLKKLNVAKVEGDVSLVHKDHIVWQIQTLEDHFSFFEKIIQQKSGSYQNKIKDLVFVNLVAKDEDSFFKPSKAKVGEYYGVLKQHSLFETIISSNFQGIFFLSQFDSGKYSIPLKWLIFRSEYEIFNFFWEGLNPREKDNLKLCLENFCICLIHMRVKKIYLYSDDDYKYLFFGTSYWKINKQINNMEKISFLTINLLEENKAEDILKN